MLRTIVKSSGQRWLILAPTFFIATAPQVSTKPNPKDFLKKLPPLSPEDERRKNELLAKVKQIIGTRDVVLFMKGTAPIPECKYSQAIANIVAFYNLQKFYTVNIKHDPLLKRALKEFSKWPYLPQLFVKGKLVGSHDTIKSMHNDGRLEELFKAEGLI